MSASVSRLARCRAFDEGAWELDLLLIWGTVPASIWKGKDPKPDDAVDSCDPVDKPNVRLSGGGGRFVSDASGWSFACVPLNDCWASGEDGG